MAIKKILIVRLYGIGNAFLSTSYIESLKREGYEVSILGDKRGVDVLKDVYPVFSFEDLKGKKVFQKIYYLSKKIHPDLIYLAYPFNDKRLLCYLRMFFRCRIAGFLEESSVLLKARFVDQKTHENTENYRALNEIFGKAFKELPMSYPIKNLSFEESKLSRPIIGIHAGSFNQPKNWGTNQFSALIEKTRKDFPNASFVLLGSNSEFEANELIRKENKALNLAGRFSIDESLSFMKNLDLLIGNDSALIHMAVLTKTPHIAIYGPTDPVKSAPWMTDPKISAQVHLNLWCQPCYRFGTEIKCINEVYFRCLKDLNVDIVYRKVYEALTRTRSI